MQRPDGVVHPPVSIRIPEGMRAVTRMEGDRLIVDVGLPLPPIDSEAIASKWLPFLSPSRPGFCERLTALASKWFRRIAALIPGRHA